MTRITASVALVAATTLTLATSARAQDARWTPWLGCWEMAREGVRAGTAIPGFTDPARPVDAKRDTPRVCVAAASSSDGVTVTTTVAGQPALEQSIIANGSEQPLNDDGCHGTQRAEWSRTGERLFTTAALTCSDQQMRTVSGLSFIAPDGTWLDIRAVRMGGNESTRVSRYRRAADQPRTAFFGAAFSLDDVKEATHKVSPRAIEAALAETTNGFNLDSHRLLDLADADVDTNVIDLIVALSYPKKFVVERTARRNVGGFDSIDPLFTSSFGYPFGLYGSLYDDFYFPAYYYSPFAYRYLGRFDPRYFGWGYYGDVAIIGGGGSGGGGNGSVEPQPSGAGRYVNGVGYTRVREREAEPQSTRMSVKGIDGASPSASGSSGGGSMSPAGYSGGSSGGAAASSGGGDGGRTAQPR